MRLIKYADHEEFAKEAVLHIASLATLTMCEALQVLYLAEKKRLTFGSVMMHGGFVACAHGPVSALAGAYLLKACAGEDDSLRVRSSVLVPLRQADAECFGAIDLECLNDGLKTFFEVPGAAQDEAWMEARLSKKDGRISYEDVAAAAGITGDALEDILMYLTFATIGDNVPELLAVLPETRPIVCPCSVAVVH